MNIKALFFLFFITFIIIVHKPGYAEYAGVVERKEVVVYFEEPLRVAAQEVADLYPEVKEKLETLIRWHIDFRPTILLLKDKEKFQMAGGSDLVVAFAIPRRNLIVIDYSKMKILPFTIEATLRHELCHLLLHRYIRRGNLPKWLDEGIAQWVSGGMIEIVMDRKRSVLNEAILSGKYIPLRHLADHFPDKRNFLLLAYEESESFVEYIVDRYGEGGILRILEQLNDGKGVNEAVWNVLSISLDDLEQEWLNHLRKRITWFIYLSNNLYEILFLIAALVTIVGFIKLMMKKRAYKDEEER